MRAIIHHEFGDPSAVLRVEDVSTPEPGPGEVRVRTLLSSIHNHDLWTIRGDYGFRPSFPARAGTEAVGVVDAIGEGVDQGMLGRRVSTGGTFGVWAEYFVAKAAGLIEVPDGVPDETAAQLVSMPFSAISLLDQLALEPGQWLVQNAANGAVGRMVAQLGAARGIRVLGLVRRAAGVDELAGQGIADVVATDAPEWRDRIRALVGDEPIVAGVDSVGGSASGEVLSLLAEGGTLVVFGAMQSPTMKLSSGDLIFTQAVVRGFWGSKVGPAMDPAKRAALFGELQQRLAEGVLTLPVHAVYGLDEVAAAAAANAEPGRTGKILLRP